MKPKNLLLPVSCFKCLPNNSSHKELTTGTAAALRKFIGSFVLDIEKKALTRVFSAINVRDTVIKAQISSLPHSLLHFGTDYSLLVTYLGNGIIRCTDLSKVGGVEKVNGFIKAVNDLLCGYLGCPPRLFGTLILSRNLLKTRMI